jgi:hypothetical protein
MFLATLVSQDANQVSICCCCYYYFYYYYCRCCRCCFINRVSASSHLQAKRRVEALHGITYRILNYTKRLSRQLTEVCMEIIIFSCFFYL